MEHSVQSVDWGRKTQVWLTEALHEMETLYKSEHLKQDSATLARPRKPVVKGDPSSQQDFRGCMRFSLCLKGEMARGMNLCWSMDFCQWFGLMVRESERTQLENWWQGDLRRKHVRRPPWIHTEYEDISVPCKCLPKVDIGRERSK